MRYKDFNISKHFEDNYGTYFNSLESTFPTIVEDETHMGDLARTLFYQINDL